MFYYWEPKELEVGDKKVPPLFAGRVKIRAPKYVEKLEYYKQYSALEASSGDKTKYLIELAKSHIVEVKLIRIEDQLEVTDVESMEYDSDLSLIMTQIAGSVLEGKRLGKDLTKN